MFSGCLVMVHWRLLRFISKVPGAGKGGLYICFHTKFYFNTKSQRSPHGKASPERCTQFSGFISLFQALRSAMTHPRGTQKYSARERDLRNGRWRENPPLSSFLLFYILVRAFLISWTCMTSRNRLSIQEKTSIALRVGIDRDITDFNIFIPGGLRQFDTNDSDSWSSISLPSPREFSALVFTISAHYYLGAYNRLHMSKERLTLAFPQTGKIVHVFTDVLNLQSKHDELPRSSSPIHWHVPYDLPNSKSVSAERKYRCMLQGVYLSRGWDDFSLNARRSKTYERFTVHGLS